MNNPEHIQLLTSDQRREESEKSAEALETSSEAAEETRKVTVSQKRFCWTVIVLIVLIAALLAALLAILFVSDRSETEHSGSLEICWSKECMGISTMIKQYRNTSVDPCDDFFEHTCGRFHEHQTQDDSWSYSQYKQLVYQVFSIVRKTPKFSSKPDEQLRLFAKKCLDRAAMDADTFRDLREDIEERGGFPFIDPNWDEAKFDLSDMLANYLSINRNRMGFLSVEPFTVKEGNRSVQRLYLSPGPHWVYNWAMGISIYKDSVAFMIARLLKLSNRELNQTLYEMEFQKLVYLEANFSKLANYDNLSMDNEDMTKARNLSDLVKMIPEIDWIKILRAMPRKGAKDQLKTEEEFLKKVTVHGGGDYFFGEKRELVRIATETPKTVLANYLVVRQLIDVALYFYDKDQARQLKFYNHENQQDFCVNQLSYFFPMPSMNIFIRNAGVNAENIKIVEGMFENIKNVYLKVFHESQYLETDVRKFLIQKLSNIDGIFGMQDYLEGKPTLEKMYETLNFLETDTPWRVYMKMWRHRTEQLVEHIVHNTPLDPVNMKMFGTHAAYLGYHNSFYINLPYLAYPWMNSDFPANTNYGYLGYVIGHEIGHAFDHFHRRLDENGSQRRVWFTATNSTNTEYERREKCLMDQYSEYREPGYNFSMNGSWCRYEIVGDHLGVRTAYDAFKRVEKLDKFRLPGMDDVSNDQLFFYNHAFRHCDVFKSYVPRRTMLARRHPTNRFRVNGVVQNFAEFAEAFQCPKSSPMNPEKKCKLF